MSLSESLNKANIVAATKSISGDGFLEENAVIHGVLISRFSIGAYSIIENGALVKNSFIGRFTTIEKNCHVG